ncbi:MAG: AAA family ATPase [Clostridia bacterium]|nr:AAA family ATPase [Clostridia bacterium]
MKLIKCHIEGFGKITSFDYTFNDKLNIIFEENGWGKTTFSVFIKSIFYGMSATRKKNLDENDRVLYTPIGGGKFGGYIEFENDGKIFRLERYFGKNEASDSELLTELSSGKTYNESNFKWGERLFGVNSDAFLRTLFLSQKDLDLSDNKCISDIIGEISSEESDINIERALKSIDEKVKDLKTTGGRGKIEEKKRQIVSVENEIFTCETAKTALNNIEEDILQKSNQLKELNLKIDGISTLSKKVREVEALKERRKLYEEKKALIETLKGKINEYDKIFADKTVTDEDFSKNLTIATEISLIKDDLLKTEEKLSELKRKKQDILVNFSSLPTKEHYDELVKLREQENEIVNEEIEIIEPSSQPKTFNYYAVLLAVLAVVTFVGIGLIFVNKIVGIVITLISGALLLVFAFLYFSNLIKGGTDSAKIESFNKELLAKKEKNQANLVKIQTLILKIKIELGFADTATDEFIKYLDNSLRKLNELCLTKEHFESYLSLKKQEESVKNQALVSFFSRFNLSEKNYTVNAIKELKIQFENMKQLSSSLAQLNKEIVELENKGINLSDDLLNADKEKLDEDERLLRKNQTELTNLIQALEISKNECLSKIDKQKELESLKVLYEDELSALNKKYELLSKTYSYLQGARKSLTEKYLKPVHDKLNDYLSKTTLNHEKTVIDLDYNISVEINGQLKSIDYCSRGWKNIFALALRLSFIDSVYEKRPLENGAKRNPFIVLDDPFVNYDDKHLNKALDFIKELSLDKQIIYFTCHSSRASGLVD